MQIMHHSNSTTLILTGQTYVTTNYYYYDHKVLLVDGLTTRLNNIEYNFVQLFYYHFPDTDTTYELLLRKGQSTSYSTRPRFN